MSWARLSGDDDAEFLRAPDLARGGIVGPTERNNAHVYDITRDQVVRGVRGRDVDRVGSGVAVEVAGTGERVPELTGEPRRALTLADVHGHERVCGVGNIYASEALFLAGVRPTVSSRSVTTKKTAALREAIVQVMNETLELGVSIPIDRMNIGGNIYGPDSDGDWRVYGREGEPCPKCETPIRRIVQGTRSTFYCHICQR